MNFGLERIHRLLDHFDRPQNSYKVIHVAGTNGKGSVCAVLSSVFAQLGVKCGRFSSPHLISPCDSITIDLKPITIADYNTLRNKVQAINDAYSINASSFEILTAMALCHFADSKVQVAVVEVGMGGRLDATNVFTSPSVCVITAIGLDHTEFLGDTVDKIAAEKAGIVKSGASVVVSFQPFASEVIPVVEAMSNAAGCYELRYATPLEMSTAKIDDSGSSQSLFEILNMKDQVSFRFRDGRLICFTMPFVGEYQLQNVATALSALDSFLVRESHLFTILNETNLITGLQNARWPGRLEWQEIESTRGVKYSCLIDGAHNQQGAQELRRYLDSCLQRTATFRRSLQICWIVGFKGGKDIGQLLNTWLRDGDCIYAVEFSSPDGMPWIQCSAGEVIIEAAKQMFPNIECGSFGDVKSTVRHLKSLDVASNDRVFVMCGSLYLISEFYRNGFV
ncbi:folylpolyglutamate synthase [Chytridiales sp. JEL 0842]|nr:folylpolyglutamate synthase [Chytridiales sp. JEL 0842]